MLTRSSYTSPESQLIVIDLPVNAFQPTKIEQDYMLTGPALAESHYIERNNMYVEIEPANHNSTISSARGLIKSILGGKQKDESKGFEIIRKI